MSDETEVLIGGVRYVRADQQPNDEAMKLLAQVYGRLWCEAHYDPMNDATRSFAEPLVGLMRRANELLRFKT